MDTVQDQKEHRTPVSLRRVLSIMGIAVSAVLIISPISEMREDSSTPVVEQPVIHVDELPDADAGGSLEYSSELASTVTKDADQAIHLNNAHFDALTMP